MLRFETEDTDIVLTVQHNKFICTELYRAYGGSSGSLEGDADSFLTKDVDYARAKLGLVRAYGEEGLHGIVGEDRDLGVDAIAGKLQTSQSAMSQSQLGSSTSSSRNDSGVIPTDRSDEMPACLPRKKCAMSFGYTRGLSCHDFAGPARQRGVSTR
jgi:hypothetical protein